MTPKILNLLDQLGLKRAWVLDFEFEVDGNAVVPSKVVCLVALDLLSGEKVYLGPSQLDACPFKWDGSELFVAFYAIAEASCFIKLGWPLPSQWIDAWVEEVRLLNGSTGNSNSLLDAMRRARLPVRDGQHKQYMQTLIGEGNWSYEDVPAILEYCEEDVLDTAALFEARCNAYLSEAPGGLSASSLGQAIVRGRFAVENARMAATGLPIDVPNYELLSRNSKAVRQRLVEEVEREHGFACFEGTTFKRERFEHYLCARDISWPRSGSGTLDLKEDTFKQMGERHSQIKPLADLRRALSVLKNSKFVVDHDARARTNLRPYSSKTGRSQPSSTAYLFGLPKWMRSLLKPGTGHAIAYLDYASQEIAIAAALSDDAGMLNGYLSGDPYMQFAKDAGLAPPHATKESHPTERQKCKAIVLGVNYGMGPDSLAARAGITRHEAEALLTQHQRAYPNFWKWTKSVQDRGALGLPIYTPYGWRIQLRGGADLNLRSLGNWPVQSTGSDILRVATILTSNAGTPPIATVHDALVFEFHAQEAETSVQVARHAMIAAAEAVIGVEVRVDAEIIEYPSIYTDDNGKDFYDMVIRLASECEAERAA